MTDTDSPYMWSNKYHMPILAMVPDDEVATARKVFGAINSKTKDENTITTALDYLDKMTYVQKLNNKEDRDKAFRDVFLEEFSLNCLMMLMKLELTFRTISQIRRIIGLEIKRLQQRLRRWLMQNIMSQGMEKQKNVIDEMPAEQVKEYLKKMIEDNFVVGLEIIKKQK